MKKITIIGGGIGGLCTAIALCQQGFQVQIYESAPQLKALGAGLALSANAVKALKQIGLDQEILSIGNSFGQVKLLTQAGKVIAQTDASKIADQYGAGNFSVHRADLQTLFVSHLPADILHLGKKCVDVQQHKEAVTAFFEDGSSTVSHGLIAFDGVHSVVRRKLLPQVKLRYAGYTCWRAVIDYIPKNFDPKLFSETWGKHGRFGIVPLTDERIYWFATRNAPQQDERMRHVQVKDLLDHFKSYHEPIAEILMHTDDTQLIWNDIIDFSPIEHYAFGRMLLAGDAAHATTPNMGQGACMAIEDATVVANCLSSHVDIPEAFQVFEQKRKKRTQRIVNQSYQLGKLAQLENGILQGVRNTLFRMIPASVNEKQIKYLYDVEL